MKKLVQYKNNIYEIHYTCSLTSSMAGKSHYVEVVAINGNKIKPIQHCWTDNRKNRESIVDKIKQTVKIVYAKIPRNEHNKEYHAFLLWDGVVQDE